MSSRSTLPEKRYALEVKWAPFEVDGMSLEWCVQRTDANVLLCIRLAGHGGGAGQVLPAHASPTVDDAIRAYRGFADLLAANDVLN